MARKLTGKQRAFTDQVAKGVNPTKAARAVGYSAPASDAYKLMRLPHVVEALRERREAALQGDLASLALDAMRDLMGDDTPAATRYQASKWILEHAGHRPEQDQGRQAKPLEEMDADELAQAVTSGMSALQELAGQLEGRHFIEGESREVRDVDQEEESADFLQ